MDIFKSFRRQAGADTGRRAFLWRFGAGTAGAMASVAVTAKPAGAEDPALRAALLDEEKALRKLHRDFQQAIDEGRHAEVVALFADDAQVIFNGGVFERRDHGISRLFREHLPARKAGGSMQAAPGFALSPSQQHDRVEVAKDLRAASAVFPYSIQCGMPIESGNSLASMARLHGEGVRTWWEGGHYRVDYRKDAEGRWQISRLEYDTVVRADYRPGRSYASAISVPRLTTRFPQDLQGPDRLV
jgi:ketosteroid isomerase-like protein